MRWVECFSIALFAVLASAGLWRLAEASGPWLIALVLIGAPLGWIASDLLSGVLHLAFDTFGSVETPLIGRAFIRPFREHHADPEAMTRHDFVETHGASCLAALPILVAAISFPAKEILLIGFQAVLVFTALGALATNQCHKWAHLPEKQTPAWVRRLQRLHLVLPREHHRRHHTPPFDSHFCMSCGWLNPFLNFLIRSFR
jgi:hypothetical protein